MFDPVTIGLGVAVWLAMRKQSNTQFGVMTIEREEMYRNALEYLKDPARLEALAVEFTREGLKLQATMLRKRAEWYGRSTDQKATHDAIFAKAMASVNVQGILGVAQAFENMSATLKAKRLRDHAAEVNASELAAISAARSEAAKTKVIVTSGETKLETKAETKPETKLNGKGTDESIPRNTEVMAPTAGE